MDVRLWSIAASQSSITISQNHLSTSNVAIKVEYYPDVLCVRAWIAQCRQEELRQDFGSEIELDLHFVNVFGNTQTQIGEKWSSKGGFKGFGQHVIQAAEPFSNAPVVADIWQTVRPFSSAPAHVVLNAVEISHSEAEAESFAYLVTYTLFHRSDRYQSIGYFARLGRGPRTEY